VKSSGVIKIEVPKGEWYVFPTLCKGCGLCKEKCPKDVMDWSDRLGFFGTPAISIKDPNNCIACGICQTVCPDCAIRLDKKRATA